MSNYPDIYSSILEGLNDKQLEAVTAPDGPVLVLAGPGSGKTRVLTHRIAFLLSKGVSPFNILAVTFTNKAAREMRERIERLVGGAFGSYEARNITMGTFHSICSRVLRRDGGAIGISPNFVIYDDDDQIRLIKQALNEIGLDEKQYAPRSIQARISSAKSALLDPEDYSSQGVSSYFDEIAARVYRRYQQLLEINQAVDFDDLLMKVVLLWKSYPDILQQYRDRWKYVLVDEYQDTNRAQYMLINLLTQEHRNIFVVGDEDQGIYSWRAADIRNILNFERDYPEAKVILLEQNYRSYQEILDVASHIISSNRLRRPKKLWTNKSGGALVRVREAYDEQDEASYIAREISRLTSLGEYTYSDFAVMYRTNSQSRPVEEAFSRYRIPYQIIGGTRFYERREVKDVLAYLRLIHNPHDAASLRRIIENTPSGRGIGKGTMKTLEDLASRAHISLWDAIEIALGIKSLEEVGAFLPNLEIPKLQSKAKESLKQLVGLIYELREQRNNLTLPHLIDTLLIKSGYASFLSSGAEEDLERLENARDLISIAQDYAAMDTSEALVEFLQEVALQSDVDTMQNNGNQVTLITLHAAKGLEYKVVFIIGFEEGLLPHARSMDRESDIEEECRLAYVGVTRAMEKLYISYAFHRNVFGATQTNVPSRFLANIPPDLLDGSLPSLGRRGPGRLTSTTSPRTPSGSTYTGGARNYSGQSYRPFPSNNNFVSSSNLERIIQEYKPGDRVRHPKFGEGVVLKVEIQGEDAEVEVRFAAGSTKKLLASMARLQKI